MIFVSKTEADFFKTLGDVIVAILPEGTEVVQAQVNRVPEVKAANFVIMTPLRRIRLATNYDVYEDCLFEASITGDLMHVTEVTFGTLEARKPVFGEDIPDGVYIVDGPSHGGPGDYTISQELVDDIPSEVMAAGVAKLMQATDFTVQLDVHGPLSGDYSQIISTIFRDEVGVALFNPDVSGVTPLYADDPRQGPYMNDQAQAENRWMIEAHLQFDPVVQVPQQFAGEVQVDLVLCDFIGDNSIGFFQIGVSQIGPILIPIP